MKLLNKKTGKIKDVNFVLITDDRKKDGAFVFRSIEQLIEEYEDYKSVEPLIKEEKNRNVIRAWARVNALPEVLYSKHEDCIYSPYGSDNTDIGVSISFDNVNVFENLQHRKLYTIEELCGEEEG